MIEPPVINREMPFRIQFFTPVVRPAALPDFAYVSTSLNFDSVMYTAIVRDRSPQAAILKIVSYWPDAIISSLEQGTAAFRANDYYLRAVEYGSYLARQKKPWWERIFGER